jgi:putative N-acetylmannosamine-6-phosphate epimerase
MLFAGVLLLVFQQTPCQALPDNALAAHPVMHAMAAAARHSALKGT